MKFQIENMTCGGCVRAVTRAVQKVDSGAEVEIDLDSRSVEVRSAKAPAEFAAALSAIGYPPAEAA